MCLSPGLLYSLMLMKFFTCETEGAAFSVVRSLTGERGRLVGALALSLGLLGTPAAQAASPAPACLQVKTVALSQPGGTALPAELNFLGAVVQSSLKPAACLTEDTLKAVLQGGNNALVSRGYVTTRLSIPEQNIATGTLRLTVTPGRIEQVVVEGGELRTAGMLPLQKGALLNVRKLEQSVETLTRLRSLKAETRIEPGSREGYSVIRIVTQKVASPYSGSVGMGAKPYTSFGGINYSASLSVDNPLKRADQLQLNLNASPSLFAGGTGSAGFSVAYTIPFRTTLFTLGGGYSTSNQARAGYTDILNYGNRGWNLYGAALWTPYRAGTRRTDLNASLKYSDSWASLNGVEINVQRARAVALDTSVQHSGQGGAWQWGVQLGNLFEYRTNPIREGLNAPSDVLYGNYDLTYTAPSASGRGVQWQTQGEFHAGVVNPQAQPFSISGANLRGAGPVQLTSDHGLILKNAVYVPVQRSATGYARAYLAADYGYVTGSNLADLPGQHLLGTALGLQGQYRKLSYDVAVGYPALQPASLPRGVNFSFNLRTSF